MAIKKLQQNFTTIEQSNRLLELGLPADSADLYSSLGFENLIWVRNTHSELREDYFNTLINGKSANTPIWSVGRLVEIYLLCCAYNFKYEFLADEKPIDTIVSSIEYAIQEHDFDFSKLED